MNELLVENLRKFRVYKERGFKFDLISAIVVFLVAIPLCLGTALASGAPLFSGILSGIIGGIIVGVISGSPVSVSGPAAGMAAVVLGAISQLGSFDAFLFALMLAGLLQIIIGSIRAGFIAEYVPSNVVQGLLCAIGILLIFKQLPLAFTHSSNITDLKIQLLDTDEGFSFEPLLSLSSHINKGASLLSLASIAVLMFFDKTAVRWLKVIPGPIVVVIMGILLNEFFIATNSPLIQSSPQLVNIPQHDGLSDFFRNMTSPDWSAWQNPKVYFYALLLAIVASLETLLNIKAAEKLDKKQRSCSKDRELIAQGLGNLAAGLIGGIPVTSVIVRTSVNIQTGAKTKLSTIFHGLFILLSVLLLPQALNKIPLSSLAAVLIYTGYKLSKPSIYLSLYRQGWDRFFPFLVTIVSIVMLNLLEGILIGLLVSMFYILKSNSQVRMNIIKEIYPNGVTNRLILPQQITFLNKASLIEELKSIPNKSQLIIDARYSDYIDKDIIEFLKEFQAQQAPHRKISLNLMGFKDNYDIHNYIDFINVTTYDVQTTLTPNRVLTILQEGNKRFLDDTQIHRSIQSDIKHTSETQHPIAVVLGCIDSRVPVETIFDMSFGDLFCVRVAGNVINDDVLASIEYATHVVGAKLIIVLGHTRCGAIQAACNEVESGFITQLLAKIQPSIDAETQTTTHRKGNNIEFVDNVTDLNIANTIWNIYKQSTILRDMIDKNDVGIVGAMYNVNSGDVNFKDFSLLLNKLGVIQDNRLAEKMQSLFSTTKGTRT
jgi:carbonic anhydrase